MGVRGSSRSQGRMWGYEKRCVSQTLHVTYLVSRFCVLCGPLLEQRSSGNGASPQHHSILVKMLSLCLLLLPLSQAIPQYNTNFKNFPTYPELRDVNTDNDEFVEDAISYTPQERDARQVGLVLPQLDDYDEDSIFEELDAPEEVRAERDGGAHGQGHGAGGHRQGRRGGRRNRPQQQQVVQDDFEAVFDEPRGGRQTGGIAPALGVLNNPPSEDGSYNFNFADDQGSTREETSRDGFVSGSYSYITPEGQEIAVSYTADETGYHPSGLPPMPVHVQRMLDHLAKVNGGR